jgi:hypothetical protein
VLTGTACRGRAAALPFAKEVRSAASTTANPAVAAHFLRLPSTRDLSVRGRCRSFPQPRVSACRYQIRGTSVDQTSLPPACVITLSKAALIVWLLPSLLAASHVRALGAVRSTSPPVRGAPAALLPLYSSRHGNTVAARVSAARKSQRRRAAARATERKLLLLAPRERLLRRFVDRTTGLVKRNVAAQCTRVWGKHPRHALHRFVCQVWMQPRSPLSGIAVVCHRAHHGFWLSAYHRRHKRHKSRHA